MGTTYSEKLKHPKWQKRRLEILKRDKFKCQLCKDTETELHIHHKKYINGREVWDYEDDTLVTLCKYCHLVVEYIKSTGYSYKAISEVLKFSSNLGKDEALIIVKDNIKGISFYLVCGDKCIYLTHFKYESALKLKKFIK